MEERGGGRRGVGMEAQWWIRKRNDRDDKKEEEAMVRLAKGHLQLQVEKRMKRRKTKKKGKVGKS